MLLFSQNYINLYISILGFLIMDEREGQKELEKRIFHASEDFLKVIIPEVGKGQKRPRMPWDIYFNLLSQITATRATCVRRAYGAEIVDEKHRPIATGYCGSARDTPNCSDLGKCFREEYGIPSGCFYDMCPSIHAESNAIKQAKGETEGKIMYVAGFDLRTRKLVCGKPCLMCQDEIIQAGIKEVRFMEEDYTLGVLVVNDLTMERRMNPYKPQLEALERLRKAGINLKGKS
jgi:dCMP deaminase